MDTITHEHTIHTAGWLHWQVARLRGTPVLTRCGVILPGAQRIDRPGRANPTCSDCKHHHPARQAVNTMRQAGANLSRWYQREDKTRLLAIGIATTAIFIFVWGLLSAISDAASIASERAANGTWFSDLLTMQAPVRIANLLYSYVDSYAATLGSSALSLLIVWGAIGAILLDANWSRGGLNVRSLGWFAWVAATATAVWLAAPDGNPLPAALTAGIGLTMGCSRAGIALFAGIALIGVIA